MISWALAKSRGVGEGIRPLEHDLIMFSFIKKPGQTGHSSAKGRKKEGARGSIEREEKNFSEGFKKVNSANVTTSWSFVVLPWQIRYRYWSRTSSSQHSQSWSFALCYQISPSYYWKLRHWIDTAGLTGVETSARYACAWCCLVGTRCLVSWWTWTRQPWTRTCTWTRAIRPSNKAERVRQDKPNIRGICVKETVITDLPIPKMNQQIYFPQDTLLTTNY